jgi:hypothetical protein
MSDICVVTCTGARPELFALCTEWVLHQTVKPSCWIVTTDTGEVPSGLPDFAQHLHVPKQWEEGPAAARHSLLYALSMVPKGNIVVVMEDDDYYMPTHIERIVQRLEETKCSVTFGDTVVRFHLPEHRWSGESKGAVDAVEGAVGIASRFVSGFAEALRDEMQKSVMGIPYNGFTCVGIKGVGHGLPGRSGATTKHRRDHFKTKRMMRDKGDANFIRILGHENASKYLRLLSA